MFGKDRKHQAPPVPAAASPDPEVAEQEALEAQLQQLAMLHAAGVLTDAQYAEENARILNQP